MFKHEKMLFHPVEVERPNPQYAVLLQEQLGGGNGELKAAMQYMSQSFRIKDPEIKDLFLDIAAEELGHMEMVAQTINLLNGHDVDATKVQAGEIQSHVLLGLNPGLINSSGYSWTGDYVTVTGDLCADLLSNIASEQRAKVVYEYLYRQIDDKKVRDIFNEKSKDNDQRDFLDIFRLVLGIGIYLIGLKLKLQGTMQIISTVICILILLSKTMRKAVSEVKRKVLDENILITISVIGACLVGKTFEGIMVITLYEIGKILESKAINKTRNSISNLMDIKPEYANLKIKRRNKTSKSRRSKYR